MTSFDGGDAAPAAATAVSSLSAVSAVSDVEQSDSVAHTEADDTATDTAASTDANVEDDADAESDEARQPDKELTVVSHHLPPHSLVWCLSVCHTPLLSLNG